MHIKFVASAATLAALAAALIACARQHEATGALTDSIGQVNTAADADSVAQAGELFHARCVMCHQAPDLAFATDRAWLHQVLDTA